MRLLLARGIGVIPCIHEDLSRCGIAVSRYGGIAVVERRVAARLMERIEREFRKGIAEVYRFHICSRKSIVSYARHAVRKEDFVAGGDERRDRPGRAGV